MNFYPFHIGDYLSHTNHLSNEEDLAYRRLIDLYYQTEQPFTRNLGWLAKRVKSTEEIVASILVEFFEETPEGWKNKRADEEIAKYKAMQEGGRKGAALRWGKGSDTPPKHPPMQTKNQEPLTKNHSIGVAKAPKAKRLSLEELPKEWEEFCKTERKDLNPTEVFNQFRDYWIAQGGQKGAKLDWFATWRNWVRNQRSKVSVSKTSEDKSWMFSNEGIEAKARELGVSDYGVANHFQLKDKILQVMAKKAMQ
jgi:uncharacterized protein YdaU (DUF1376 family)